MMRARAVGREVQPRALGRRVGRQTLLVGKGRHWMAPSDGKGARVTDSPPAVAFTVLPELLLEGLKPTLTEIAPTNSEIARVAPLVHPEAFDWLAQFQNGRTYLAISYRANNTASNVSRDCARLAALLEIPLIPTRRGPRQRKRVPSRPI